jgi:hypothetical protein
MDPSLIAPIAQGVGGIIQAFTGGGKAGRAERELSKMVKEYKPNQSILDFYNKALSRYNVNPYTSSLYNYQQDQARGATAAGIQALGGRRSTLAGLPRLIQGQNDAMLKAAATAEGQQAQALGQLGQATQMKAAEDFKPFELKYNLNMMKAGGGNQIMNAGLSNIFGGIQNYGNTQQIKKMYG